MIEPVIHSHATDELPGDHPLANEQVGCVRCDVLVHAWNNECMQTWVELPVDWHGVNRSGRTLCLFCFVAVDGGTAQWSERVAKPSWPERNTVGD